MSKAPDTNRTPGAPALDHRRESVARVSIDAIASVAGPVGERPALNRPGRRARAGTSGARKIGVVPDVVDGRTLVQWTA